MYLFPFLKSHSIILYTHLYTALFLSVTSFPPALKLRSKLHWVWVTLYSKHWHVGKTRFAHSLPSQIMRFTDEAQLPAVRWRVHSLGAIFIRIIMYFERAYFTCDFAQGPPLFLIGVYGVCCSYVSLNNQ